MSFPCTNSWPRDVSKAEHQVNYIANRCKVDINYFCRPASVGEDPSKTSVPRTHLPTDPLTNALSQAALGREGPIESGSWSGTGRPSRSIPIGVRCRTVAGGPQRSQEWPRLPIAHQIHREQEWDEGIIGKEGRKSWRSSLIGAPVRSVGPKVWGEYMFHHD